MELIGLTYDCERTFFEQIFLDQIWINLTILSDLVSGISSFTDLKQKKVGIWIREIKSKDTKMTWEGSTACLKEVETEYFKL